MAQGHTVIYGFISSTSQKEVVSNVQISYIKVLILKFVFLSNMYLKGIFSISNEK